MRSQDKKYRVLVAGIGNVLRTDDGFGPAVIQALSRNDLPPGLRTAELGIGGVALVHELMDGYDALILVDAVDRGGPPGTLYVLAPEIPEQTSAPFSADLHQVVPGLALVLARAAGSLPPFVRLVGCQPADTDTLGTALSPVVESAVPRAVETILSLLASGS